MNTFSNNFDEIEDFEVVGAETILLLLCEAILKQGKPCKVLSKSPDFFPANCKVVKKEEQICGNCLGSMISQYIIANSLFEHYRMN